MKEVTNYFRLAIPYYERQTFKEFELIILPNEGGENEFKTIKNVQIINTGKVSPAIKRNIGVEKAKGEIIAFIDDDAYPEKDWLENAHKIFRNKEIVGIGGPGVLPKGATFFQKVSSKVYALSSKMTGIRYEKGKKQQIDDWPTCNFLVRKDEFIKAGGFDARYWGGEDTQICYSLVNTGKKLVYDPDVMVYHHPRASFKNHLRQSFFWGMWRGFFTKVYPKNSRKLLFFIPSIFFIWVIMGAAISIAFKPAFYVYSFTLGAYLLFLLWTGARTRSIKLFIPVMFVTAITHIAYGIGFIKGLFANKYGPTKSGMHPKEDLRTERPL